MSAVPNIQAGAYLQWIDASGVLQSFTFDIVTSEDWSEDAEITEHPVEQGANVADHVRVRLPQCELRIFATNEPMGSNAFADPQQLPNTLNVGTPFWVPASGIIQVTQWVNPIGLRALANELAGVIAGPIGSVVAENVTGALLPGFEVTLPVITDAGLVPPTPGPPPVAQTMQFLNPTDFVEETWAKLLQLKNAAQLIDVYGTKQSEANMVIERLSIHRGADSGTGAEIVIGLKTIRIVSTQTVAVAPIPNLPAGGGTPPVNKGTQNPTQPPAAQASLLLQGGQKILGALGSLGSIP